MTETLSFLNRAESFNIITCKDFIVPGTFNNYLESNIFVDERANMLVSALISPAKVKFDYATWYF